MSLFAPILERRELTFTVYGVPKPKGSKTGFVVGKRHPDPAMKGWVFRPRAILADAKGGKSHKALKDWEETVRLYTRSAMALAGWETPMGGAIGLDLVFAVPRPKSVPKSRKYPHVKPDRDKLGRAVQDALERAGLYENDSRVCKGPIDKIYAEGRPGVTIHIWQLD